MWRALGVDLPDWQRRDSTVSIAFQCFSVRLPMIFVSRSAVSLIRLLKLNVATNIPIGIIRPLMPEKGGLLLASFLVLLTLVTMCILPSSFPFSASCRVSHATGI